MTFQGSVAWKNNKKDECYILYFTAVEDLQRLFPTSSISGYPDLSQQISSAFNTSKDMVGMASRSRGAVQLRKALDSIMTLCHQVSNFTPQLL